MCYPNLVMPKAPSKAVRNHVAEIRRYYGKSISQFDGGVDLCEKVSHDLGIELTLAQARRIMRELKVK